MQLTNGPDPRAPTAEPTAQIVVIIEEYDSIIYVLNGLMIITFFFVSPVEDSLERILESIEYSNGIP